MFRIVLATAVITAAFASSIDAATASPLAQIGGVSRAGVLSHEMFVQNIHWERRGHHRVWVPDHRRRMSRYDRR